MAPKELVAVAGHRQARPPSIEHPFQVYLTQWTTQLKRRRSSNNTITNCRSGPPDIRQSPLKRPRATLQVDANLLTSLCTRTAPHRRQLLCLAPHRPACQGEDLDSYHVRAIYAALDVPGVTGNGYEDGEELTRACLRSNRSLVRHFLIDPSSRTSTVLHSPPLRLRATASSIFSNDPCFTHQETGW
jgi:hypothetical protein